MTRNALKNLNNTKLSHYFNNPQLWQNFESTAE